MNQMLEKLSATGSQHRRNYKFLEPSKKNIPKFLRETSSSSSPSSALSQQSYSLWQLAREKMLKDLVQFLWRRQYKWIWSWEAKIGNWHLKLTLIMWLLCLNFLVAPQFFSCLQEKIQKPKLWAIFPALGPTTPALSTLELHNYSSLNSSCFWQPHIFA